MTHRSRWALVLLCLALAWSAGSATAQAAGDASPTVPLDDPAYEVMQELAQAGLFTGLPDGSFHGKRNLHRSEFLYSLRTIFGQLSRLEEEGFRMRRPRNLHTRLMATAREFSPELIQAGATPAQIRETVNRMDRAFRDQHPRGVSEPYRSEAWPPDVEARTRGIRAAAEEWSHGEVVLYASPEQLRRRDVWRQPLSSPQVDVSDALPIRVIGDESPFSGISEYIAGHNAEVWQRLRREGPPSGSRLSWLADVFNLPGLWQRRPREAQDVDQALAPDGRICGVHLTRLLDLSCFGHAATPGVFEINLPDEACSGSVLWGPPGSAVLFIRTQSGKGTGRETRYYAIDLRMGVTLNAAWSRS